MSDLSFPLSVSLTTLASGPGAEKQELSRISLGRFEQYESLTLRSIRVNHERALRAVRGRLAALRAFHRLHGQTARPLDIKPSTSMTRKTMTKRKKRSFAIPAAAEAIPPKPNTAATTATIKKTTAQYNIGYPPFETSHTRYVHLGCDDVRQFYTQALPTHLRLKRPRCLSDMVKLMC